jgi:pimeloyl-ACP methyl ester carboxylesterase
MPTTSRQRLRLSGGSELSFMVAGEPSKPAVLLLHGFPNAARMFEAVMSELSDTAYLIAPDLPGSGESDPLLSATFPAFGQAIAELLDHLSIGPRYVYLHDWGAPVGFHIAMEAPEKILGLVIQNANAHRTGFSPLWDQSEAYWANPTPEREAKVTAVLTLKGIRDQYVMGVPEDVAARISATEWEEDWRVMNLPGRMDTRRALLFEYGHYVARFGELTAYLKHEQPPALMLWGRHDAFFDIAETVSWMEDLPRMEAHVFDAGHLLLETHSAKVAPLMREFIGRTEQARNSA